MLWSVSVFNVNASSVLSTRWSKPTVADEGIESSYRQMNQARLRTCSRSPELRLLAVAIAFVLRNLWALCRWMTLARSRPGRPSGETNFRFRTLLRWISRMVETRLTLQTTLELPTPSPTRFGLKIISPHCGLLSLFNQVLFSHFLTLLSLL